MKNRTGLAVLTLVAGTFFMGCAGGVSYKQMDLRASVPNKKILNLKNYSTTDVDYYKQEEKLIDGLINKSGPEYGYYSLGYTDDISAPNAELGVYLFPLALVGVPTDSDYHSVSASLTIYDSNKRQVKSYNKKDSFKQTGGYYYGHDATGKAEAVYSRMFSDIFELATLDSAEINAALEKAGPIGN